MPKLFSSLEKLPGPEEVEGLDGNMCTATHKGTVTMYLGTHERVFKNAYLCPSSVHTIVPGKRFDNADYCFMGKDRSMNVLKRTPPSEPDEILVTYPRDIELDQDNHYSSDFLSNLGAEIDGKREHTIYPVPDSAFVWHQAVANVATRSSSSKEMDKPSPSHEEKKAQSIDLLAHYHHTHGHRSAEHTARMYEYEAGYKLSADAMATQLPCEACDVAKIVSHPNQVRRVVPITQVGSDIAADTIVSMPRSLSGFNHAAHVHDIESNYGKIFCLKTKACGDRLLYWIKWFQLRTGKVTTRCHIDGGEMKSARLCAALEQQGTEIVENLADVHSNTTIERRHRDVIQIHNAQMHTGHAGPFSGSLACPTLAKSSTCHSPSKPCVKQGACSTLSNAHPHPSS